jgi:hypothetical protein
MAALSHHLPELNYLLGVSAGIKLLGTNSMWKPKAMEAEFIVNDTHGFLN